MKLSGIYKIQSIIKPERIYIGSAINIRNRWYHHKEYLRRNEHENSKLQNHYNKYGKEDLIYSVIVGCAKENLISYEQFYIDVLSPVFNCRLIAQSNLGIKHQPHTKPRKPYPVVSEETRRKLKEAKTKWWEEFNKDRQHFVFKKDQKQNGQNKKRWY